MPQTITFHPVPAAAYRAFAKYHYRGAKLGPTAGAWVARQNRRDVGIVVYAHAGLAARPRRLALVRQLWGGPLRERVKHLKDNLRVLQRLVVLPDWRGQGIASALVRHSLPLVGVPYVEAMAANPRALIRGGMRRIETVNESGPLAAARKIIAELNLKLAAFTCAAARVEQLASLAQPERASLRRALCAAWRDWAQSHGSARRNKRLGETSGAAQQDFWQTLATPVHYLLWRLPLPWHEREEAAC